MIKSAQMNNPNGKHPIYTSSMVSFFFLFKPDWEEKKMKEIKTSKSNNEEKTVGRRRILNICIYFGPRIDH